MPPDRTAASALRVPGPLSPRNASYRMHAHLDAGTHRVKAEGTLTWRNLERQPADKLVFHLYQNAFKNYASNFIFEVGPQLRGDTMPAHGFGAIDVSTLKVNGHDLLARASLDDTLLTVPLDTPIGPSATVEIQLAWTVQLPRVFARSGFSGGFSAVTQWFPKIGVFECGETPQSCRWRAHQYHGITEFFADYGVYDVEIDVPATLLVGATGVLVAEKEVQGPGSNNRRRLLSYHAEDVHDFAFFADSNFIEVDDRIDDAYGGVAVRLLTRPGQEAYTPRHLAALRTGMLEAERRLGMYPYGNITVVIPPGDAGGAAGMEYPTLFASTVMPVPSGVHILEDVTAHEFMHQYFYGLLGSDEVEESWLDEGLNETFTGWVLDRLFGARCSFVDLPYLCLSVVDELRLASRDARRYFPIATRGFTLPVDVYGSITYSQTALMMRTLERYLGEERMAAGLRRYAERFRFRHPQHADFVAAMGEGAQEDLSWFFGQALDSTRVADYEVLSVSSKPHELAEGWWDCSPQSLAMADPPADSADPVDAEQRRARQELIRESQRAACAPLDKEKAKDSRLVSGNRRELSSEHSKPEHALYDNEVVVRRGGEFLFPVDILLSFADGSSERSVWSLAEQQAAPEVRIKTVRALRRTSPLVRADVDPEHKLLLDENRINDGRYVTPQKRPVARLFFSLVGALHTLLDLLGA